MKLYEVLLEDKKQVQEAPMGMLNTLGNKAMSKLGNDRATGKLSTGALANQLHKEFQTYLGKTGREATKDAVMGFLSSKGYPTQGAATIINTALKGAGAAPTGPMANLKSTARGVATSAKQALSKAGTQAKSALSTATTNVGNAAASAKDALVKGAGSIADKLKPELTAAPINQTNNQIEPTMGDETPTTTGPADLKSKIRARTGANSAPSGYSAYRANAKAKGISNASKQVDSSKMVAEAGPGVLPQGIIDKAILKAAQEAEIMNAKQGKTSARQTAPSGNTQPTAGASADAVAGAPGSAETPGDGASSSGGFGAGFKKGLTGKAPAAPDINQLAQRIAAIEKKVGIA
jgi:hypothetical protein